MFSSTSRSRNDALGTGSTKQRVHSFHFAVQRRSAGPCQAVVSTAALVECFAGHVGGFLNPTSFQEALDRPIKGAGPHSQLTVGMSLNLFLDTVAMTLARGEGEQNMKDCWC